MSKSDIGIQDDQIHAEPVGAGAELKPEELSLDALIRLINSERLKQLQEKSYDLLKSLKEGQQKVADLNKLLKSINTAMGSDGALDLAQHPDIKALLEEAQELGVDIDPTKMNYNPEEVKRLQENIRLTVEDLKVQNDLLMHQFSQMTNERLETFQMARSIMKPLHESKMNHAKNIGR